MSHYFENDNNLKSEIRKLDYKYQDFSFEFNSDNGVFSKDRIDYGSKLLLETFIENNTNPNNILDLGCGYGFIGVVLNKIFNCNVDMVDINERAIHLVKLNVSLNKATCKYFLSNIYESVTNKYNYIICNPPIRAGKEVVLNMLVNAKDYLNSKGELWFVMRKDHGLKSTLNILKDNYNCRIIKKSKTFYVICSKVID